MNPEILRWWNLPHSISDEQWEEVYEDQLFEAKKQLRQAFFTPKLFLNKLNTYQKWASALRPEIKWLVNESISFNDLSSFENWMSQANLELNQVSDFESLVLTGHQILIGLEAYRALIFQMTQEWSGEEENVQVNSKEVFPSGAFLLAMRRGQTKEEWKITLLKERKRLSFVF